MCFVVSALAERSRHHSEEEDTHKHKPITCYDCNSEYDPNCGEHFEPSTLGTVNCSLRSIPEHLNQTLEAVLCRKLVMKSK